MFEYARRDWDDAREVAGLRAGVGLDVCEVRGRAGFGAEPQEEDVYAAERVESFEVTFEPAFEVVRVRAHRREALNLCEEGVAEQTLEVAHEAQTVLHTH